MRNLKILTAFRSGGVQVRFCRPGIYYGTEDENLHEASFLLIVLWLAYTGYSQSVAQLHLET